MNLLPGVQARLERAPEIRMQAAQRALQPCRLDLPHAAGEIRLVEDADGAEALLFALHSTPIAAIAIDSEYSFSRPGLELRSKKDWNDIRSQRPICVSVAAWLTADGAGQPDVALRAVLDVRKPGVARVLGEILRLHVPFVFHHAKVELFTFWALELDPDFFAIYDTSIVAACLHLGSMHKRTAVADRANIAEQIHSESELEERKAHLLSLVGQCEHYGLGYPHSMSKDELRQRFLRLKPDEPLDSALVEYAAADAEWTLRLHIAQQADVIRSGIAAHLQQVEFPFIVANARMEWRGVHVEPARREQLRAAATNAATVFAAGLKGHGIDPPGSRVQFLVLMRSLGHAEHFMRDGEPCTADELLEMFEHLHPAVRVFRLHQRYRRLASEEWLTGAMTGADGRVHPAHKQLGAATGRNTCSTPNIAGIGKVLRPVVSAPPGRAIIELDYSQIEVGVAAAEYGDPDLVAAYNSGDVYAAAAQRFYVSELSSDERALTPLDFKRARPEMRNAMKTFVLAVIYNIQAQALSTRFGIAVEQAQRERDRFLDLFPTLKRRLEEASVYGLSRAYATTVLGLRRRVESRGRAGSWTKNYLRNTPIQGSAAVVFKRAVIDLDREFRGTDTWLILPVHDAVVIECAIENVTDVCERAERIMKSALRSFYPQLEPRVDVNAADTRCWNKDGHGKSLEWFLSDPNIQLDARPRQRFQVVEPVIGVHVERTASEQLEFEEWMERRVHFA